jgi:hypothetical protein
MQVPFGSTQDDENAGPSAPLKDASLRMTVFFVRALETED